MGAFALDTPAASRGQVRILAQTGPTRHPMLPEVPTTEEIGMPDVSVIFWWGIFAPPKTPQPVVEHLARNLDMTLNEPALRDRFSTAGTAVAYMPPAEFAKRVLEDQKKWTKLIS